MSGPSNVEGPPITDKRQLAAYHEAGTSRRKTRGVGTEHEKFVFRRADLSTGFPTRGRWHWRAARHGMTRFGWKPVIEKGNIIALSNDVDVRSRWSRAGSSSFRGAPLDLHATKAELDEHLRQVRRGLRRSWGLASRRLASIRWRGATDMPFMPKGRYSIMRDYMPKEGTLGLDMMLRTCTVQVNLDFCSEADMVTQAARRLGAAAARDALVRQLAILRRASRTGCFEPRAGLDGYR